MYRHIDILNTPLVLASSAMLVINKQRQQLTGVTLGGKSRAVERETGVVTVSTASPPASPPPPRSVRGF